MKTLLIILSLFIVFSIQLFAQDSANLNGKPRISKPIINAFNKVDSIVIIDSLAFSKELDSIKIIQQKRQKEILLLKEQELLMIKKVNKRRMYFTIGAIAILIFVLIIFIGLIFIVRKSQDN